MKRLGGYQGVLGGLQGLWGALLSIWTILRGGLGVFWGVLGYLISHRCLSGTPEIRGSRWPLRGHLLRGHGALEGLWILGKVWGSQGGFWGPRGT